MPVELGEDAAAIGLVIKAGEQIDGLVDPPELGEGLRQLVQRAIS
jgi:hypothetical protein